MHPSTWVLLGAAVAAAVYGPMVDSAFTWFYVPLTAFYAALLEWLDRRLGFRDRVRWGLTVAALGNLVNVVTGAICPMQQPSPQRR